MAFAGDPIGDLSMEELVDMDFDDLMRATSR